RGTGHRRRPGKEGAQFRLWRTGAGYSRRTSVSVVQSLPGVEAVHPAEGAELRDEEVAAPVERDAMRREHEAGAPLRGRHLVRTGALLRIGADPCDDRPGLVEDGDPAVQLTDDRIVAIDHDGCREEEPFRDRSEELAVERQVHDTVVR